MQPLDARQNLETMPAFERIAYVLRDEIISGGMVCGQQLVEQDLAQTLNVSRNTIREALRCLHGEGLVCYQRNYGVTVRSLGIADVVDIYLARNAIEVSALEGGRRVPPHIVDMLAGIVNEAEAAVYAKDEQKVATYSLRFHQGIVAIHGSARLQYFFATIAAQLRLLFASVPDEARFQVPWVARDREILNALRAGCYDDAKHILRHYINESEQSLIRLLTSIQS